MNEPGREGLSRRSLLKRAGVGAALVWSAPIITSLNTPAYAGSPPPPECQNCGPCQLTSSCRGGPCGCVGVPDCFCTGLAVCNESDPICRTDADCVRWTGPGSRCAPCAFGPDCVETTCFAPCGTSIKAKLPPGAHVIQLSA